MSAMLLFLCCFVIFLISVNGVIAIDSSNSVSGIVMNLDNKCQFQSPTICNSLSSCFDISCKYMNKSSSITVIGFNPNLCASNIQFKYIMENFLKQTTKSFNGAIITPLNNTCGEMSTGNKCDTLESCYIMMCSNQAKYLFPSKITFISPYVCDF